MSKYGGGEWLPHRWDLGQRFECPICEEGEAESRFRSKDGTWLWVECFDCGAVVTMHGLQGTYGTKAGLIPHPSSINIWYPQMIAKLLKEIGVVSDKFETMEMIIEILQGGQDARVVG